MDSILLPSQIDLSKIKYGAVKVLPSGGKSIYVSHGGAPLMIQTPERRSPFGLSKWDKTEKGSDGVEKDTYKYDLLLGFDGKESRENLNTFYEKLSELDTKLISDGMENSMSWLGKKYTSTEVVTELYTPLIRHSRDKNTGEVTDKYPPTFKLTVPYRDGKFQCTVYGPDKSEIDLSNINLQGARVVAIVQCVGIWVVGKKYGCSWKVIQMKVTPRSNIPKFAIRDVEDDKAVEDDVEEEDVETAVQAVQAVAETDVVSSSDDDNDDELDAKPKAVAKSNKK